MARNVLIGLANASCYVVCGGCYWLVAGAWLAGAFLLRVVAGLVLHALLGTLWLLCWLSEAARSPRAAWTKLTQLLVRLTGQAGRRLLSLVWPLVSALLVEPLLPRHRAAALAARRCRRFAVEEA
jgi:hypothetical protein